MNRTSVSVMPWWGSQSSGQSCGSIVKPDVPRYTPSIRPSCDAGVWLGWGAAAAGDEFGPPVTDGDAAVVAAVDPAVVADADEAVALADVGAADEPVASVDDAVLSSLPHAARTRHDAATAPKSKRDTFMVPLPPM